MTDRDAIEKIYNDMPENDEQAEAWSLAISALQERVARCVEREMTDCKYSGAECDSKRCTDDCEFRTPKDDQSTDIDCTPCVLCGSPLHNCDDCCWGDLPEEDDHETD